MSKDKEQVKVYLNRETKIKVNRYIAKFYERSYGAISDLIERAVLNYIEPDEAGNTQLHKNPVTVSRADRDCQQIVQYIKGEGYLLQFTRDILYKAIGTVRGTDHRTLEKWHKNLLQYGWIEKHPSGMIFEFGPQAKTNLHEEGE